MVRDRYGVWSSVTENLSVRGCLIFTSRLLRAGTRVKMTFSSDLFPEDLEVVGEAAWSTGDRLGVAFTADPAGSRSLSDWLGKVIEYGAVPDPSAPYRVVPSVHSLPRVPVRLARPEPAREPRELVALARNDARAAAPAHAIVP
jgi:hypothetical protein